MRKSENCLDRFVCCLVHLDIINTWTLTQLTNSYFFIFMMPNQKIEIMANAKVISRYKFAINIMAIGLATKREKKRFIEFVLLIHVSLVRFFRDHIEHNKTKILKCKVRDVRGFSHLFWLNKDLKWKTIIIHRCEWVFLTFATDNEHTHQNNEKNTKKPFFL